MKKIIVLLIIMMLGVTGCKKDSAETQASPVVTATPVPTATPTPVPTAIPTATPEVIDIPDEDEFLSQLDSILKEIGVDDVKTISVKYHEPHEMTDSYGFILKTSTTELTLTTLYFLGVTTPTPEWSIIKLEDSITSKIIWVSEEFRKQDDIYDYKTGKLISKKSEEPKTTEEIWAEYEKKSKEIEKKYEKGLQDIIDGMEQ